MCSVPSWLRWILKFYFNPNSHLMRWFMRFQEFNFDVTYRKSLLYTQADGLSRIRLLKKRLLSRCRDSHISAPLSSSFKWLDVVADVDDLLGVTNVIAVSLLPITRRRATPGTESRCVLSHYACLFWQGGEGTNCAWWSECIVPF